MSAEPKHISAMTPAEIENFRLAHGLRDAPRGATGAKALKDMSAADYAEAKRRVLAGLPEGNP